MGSSATEVNNTETKLSKITDDSGYIDTSNNQVFLDDQVSSFYIQVEHQRFC